MTQPGDQPNPWSREGQWPNQNQPESDPLVEFDAPPAPKPPTAMYPAPYQSQPTGFYPPPMPYVPPPPRRRIGLWVALGAAMAVVVGLAMWGVIADNRAHPVVSSSGSGADQASTGETKVVTATDKKSQLTVPMSWKDVPSSFKINGVAIQLGDLRREQYIAVTSIDMTDFADFASFADASLDVVRNAIEGAQIGPRSAVTVDGLNGVRYEITGTSAGIKGVFWFTMIEGKRGFYQVVGWTLPSKRAEAEPVILTVSDSFRELAAS